MIKELRTAIAITLIIANLAIQEAKVEDDQHAEDVQRDTIDPEDIDGDTLNSIESEHEDLDLDTLNSVDDEHAEAFVAGMEVDPDSLPIIKREMKPSKVCPEVEEEIVYRRYDHEEDGVLVYDVIAQTIVTQVQHVSNIDQTKDPWLKGTVVTIPRLICLDQDDHELIEIIRRDLLIPPSKEPYNFSKPVDDLQIYSEAGEAINVNNLVYKGNLEGGFFIEAGSSDCESSSDSLYFELGHGWTGLLVEPHPLSFSDGLTRHRKATSLNMCLSTEKRPQIVDFGMTSESQGMETIVPGGSGGGRTMKVQCLPLYSLILAMGNPTVHYISLDIEGAELAVLKTVPWEKVDVRVLSVESHFSLPGQAFPGSQQELVSFMSSQGYRLVYSTDLPNLTIDNLFVKQDIEIDEEYLQQLKQQQRNDSQL